MKSLFTRIWLSYWLVMAVTVAAAVALAFGVAVKRAEETDRLSPASLAVEAQAALTRGGRDALNGWIVMEWHRRPELMVYFVEPGGRELLSRTIIGKTLPSAQGAPAPSIVARDGTVYRMLVRRTNGLAFGVWQVTTAPGALLFLAILVSGAGCALLAHQLTRPVVALRSGVRALAAGSLRTRMSPGLTRRKDELGFLARDFNHMADELREMIVAREALLRDVSHELRSPLSRLRVAAGLARQGGPAANGPQFERIDREVERLDAMIAQILRFSRLGSGPAPAVEPVDLGALLDEIADDARIEAAAAGKSIDLAVAARPIVVGERDLLRSAVENVVRNAIRFAREKSAVRIALLADDERASILVEDEGPGVAAADLPSLFQPFFRAGERDGTGLGLAIAQRIVDLHGGHISADNRRPRGLRVRIDLPVPPKAAAAQ
jgi:two-component system sensor histidine kinase CpxA